MSEIKFCENNFIHGTEKLVDTFKEDVKNVVTVEPCLGYCGDCASGPYALVDDELIQADTADELYKKIKEKIQ